MRRAWLLVAGVLALGAAWPAPPAPAPPLVRVLTGRASVATGFEVRPGRVVTVAHALGGPVIVRGRRASVLRIDRRNDLAVLAVRVAGAGPSPPAGGTRILTLRGALPARVRRRIVARVGTATRPALELAADVASGDSGAPVLGPDGRVLGVVFASSRRRAATAYAVDARALGPLRE